MQSNYGAGYEEGGAPKLGCVGSFWKCRQKQKKKLLNVRYINFHIVVFDTISIDLSIYYLFLEDYNKNVKVGVYAHYDFKGATIMEN